MSLVELDLGTTATITFNDPDRHNSLTLAMFEEIDAALERVENEVEGASLLRYPDLGPLRTALARQWDLQPSEVLVTAGADDALFRACVAVAGFSCAFRRRVWCVASIAGCVCGTKKLQAGPGSNLKCA